MLSCFKYEHVDVQSLKVWDISPFLQFQVPELDYINKL